MQTLMAAGSAIGQRMMSMVSRWVIVMIVMMIMMMIVMMMMIMMLSQGAPAAAPS